MLHIKKRHPSVKIRTGLRNAAKTLVWKQISPTDTDALRDYFDGLTFKDDLRESLCNEQHHICAYCMRRIDYKKAEQVKIEHFEPLSKDKEKVLDYTTIYFVVMEAQKQLSFPIPNEFYPAIAAKEIKRFY